MKFNWKNMLIACMFVLPANLPFTQSTYAEPVKLAQDVKVQVNDSLVVFPDVQPFLDENHKLQVPARIVADKLGYQISWEPVGSEIKVTLKNNQTNVSITTGEQDISINGQKSKMEKPAQLVDGRVYIPFRLISDSFGIKEQWDGTNRIAILGADGQYHAPAWYNPQLNKPAYEKVIDARATAYTASPDENGGYGALDFMGNPLKLGTIAVDPSVIPLGSKVYIEGYSYTGLPTGGMYAYATDTGSAVKGNKIDIFLPENKNQARIFGVQQVKVYVLSS